MGLPPDTCPSCNYYPTGSPCVSCGCWFGGVDADFELGDVVSLTGIIVFIDYKSRSFVVETPNGRIVSFRMDETSLIERGK